MSVTTMQTDRFAPLGVAGAIAGAFDLLGRVPDGPLLLLARVAPAIVFFKSGLNKTDNWDSTLDLSPPSTSCRFCRTSSPRISARRAS